MLPSLRPAGAARSRRPGTAGKLALGLVTLLNVALSLALAVYNRRETLKVLRRQDGAMLVISAQKETKAGKNP